MQKIDIRPLKQALRQEIKLWRKSLAPEEKAQMDERICARVTGLREYAACDTLLTYVSTPIEVDTWPLIERALADGKRVAVPRCIDGTRQMAFYYIRSYDDLAPGTFGVLEPLPERCALWKPAGTCLCIVPALAYDRAGFRLGYGAGYYDRFLSGYHGAKVGIIYQHNLRARLWSGRFDIPIELLVTETRLWHTEKARPTEKQLRQMHLK